MNEREANHHESASQTAGPFVHIGCTPNASGIDAVFPHDLGSCMVHGDVEGERILLCGGIYDGLGEPVTDALVEIWQVDSHGLPAPQVSRETADTPHFCGWGRTAVDASNGEFRFDTLKPGPISDDGKRRHAPHVNLWIVARGINIGLHTRLYFPEDTDAHAHDSLLQAVGSDGRRRSLIATRKESNVYRFDIHLQGPDETVFLDI